MSRLKRLCILPMAVFVVFSFSAPDVDARRGDRIERRGPSKSGRMKLRDRKERRDRHERLSNRRERWERVSDRRERRERWESRERWADRRHERHERRKTARHFAIGATIAAAALRSLTCQERVVVVDGISYHQCGSTWYERRFRGGDTVNIVVAPPPGY